MVFLSWEIGWPGLPRHANGCINMEACGLSGPSKSLTTLPWEYKEEPLGGCG